MYCFASLVKYLKKHSDNPSVTDEGFLNDFILPFIQACGVENKKGEELYLNASRVSRLLSRKDEVPEALRAKIDSYESASRTTREMFHFTADHFDKADRTTLMEGALSLAKESDAVTQCEHDELRSHSGNLESFLTAALFLALRKTNVQPDGHCAVFRSGPFEVRAQRGDILDIAFDKRSKRSSIVVIPVNDRFSTRVERRIEGCGLPEVSDETIHGKWLIRMEQSGEDMAKLKQRINIDLELRGNGNKASHPIGTVVAIDKDPITFFLLAVSTFNENNNARSDSKRIAEATESLLRFHDRYGQGREMYIPLLGSGLSRAHLSEQESFDLLVSTIEKNRETVSGSITLVIYRNLPAVINYQGRCF